MTDYSELVKALRCCAENFGCPIECPRYSPADEGVRACVSRLEKDAADAIEALQAENADIREELFISQRKYDEFTTIASMQNAMLAKQLPKQGEWIYKPKDAIEMMFTLPKCSVCGHESSDANNFCPNCGADMRKMEVQE